MNHYFHKYGLLDYIDFDEAGENPWMEFVDEDMDQYGIMCIIVCDCGENYFWTD